jgi:hypothetical protein
MGEVGARRLYEALHSSGETPTSRARVAECICLFLPPRHRPSPVHYRGRLPACTRRNDFMTDRFFETAAISLCSGPQVCSPPRSFLPLRLVAAGQPRLLRPSRACFVASACIGYANHPPRQLVVWGLTPHEIHSLVGCSSAMAISTLILIQMDQSCILFCANALQYASQIDS